MADQRRRCAGCGGWLASDNTTTLCSPCQSANGARPAPPSQVPADFWLDEDMRAALDSRHMGRVIRAYREHPYHGRRGLTQATVASWAGITQGQVSTIESPTGPPINRLDRLISWAQLLGVPEEHLWFELPRDDPPSKAEATARWTPPASAASPHPHPVPSGVDASLHESSLAAERAAALGVDLWDLLDALEASKVSSTSLALAEEACTQLDTRYAELPPTVLLPELRRQLNHVVAWLKDPQPVAYRQRLSTLAGRLAGLRAWLYFDMAELDGASAWFAAAVRAAQEAEDHDLCGYLLGAQSLIPVDQGDYATAASLLEAGQELARQGRQTTRAWLDILEARVLAGSGDSQGFNTAYRLAEKRLPRTTLDERRHGMDFAGERLDITYYKGLSHLLLVQPSAAADAFEAALRALRTTRVKARAILSLSLAIAFAQASQRDQAAATATEALAIAGDQPVGRIRQRAEDVRQLLGPAARSSAVREFDERLTCFVGTLEQITPEPST